MKARLRVFFQIFASLFCMFQAFQAFKKYFEYPVVVQTSERARNADERALFYICETKFSFDYPLAKEFGYASFSSFLAGDLLGSEIPSWKGINGSSSYHELFKILLNNDFSQVKVNEDTEKMFIFHNGFCLKTFRTSKEMLEVATNSKALKIYPSHPLIDLKITNAKTPEDTVMLDVDENFHYLRYELIYEVHDNSIHDGISCVDYRRLQEDYGDCLYRAFKKDTYATYGCYLPWIDDVGENVCEEHETPTTNRNGHYDKIFDDLNALTDGDDIDSMKKCLPPCYTVKMFLKKRSHFKNTRDYSFAIITNGLDTVKVYKSAYSYDLFALITELGSSFGLWLGM